MDIAISLIDSEFKVIKTVSAYPRKDDCVEVEIKNVDGQIWTASYFPKTKLELIKTLQVAKSRMSYQEFVLLVASINKHIEYAVDVANDENAMLDAGESL